jgi:hypothetical protein
MQKDTKLLISTPIDISYSSTLLIYNVNSCATSSLSKPKEDQRCLYHCLARKSRSFIMCVQSRLRNSAHSLAKSANCATVDE